MDVKNYTTTCLGLFWMLMVSVPTILFAQQDPNLIPFYHGVASGDPMADRVILWTRVTPEQLDEVVEVQWQIATDTSFDHIVNRGTVFTDSTSDFTLKVDVLGLSPNTLYFYRFWALGKYSLIGRTKTAPTAMVDQLRFAVVSCSNYANGLYNAYQQVTEKNNVDAVIHLGDYIYEHGGGGVRDHVPNREIITLPDYRQRHASYKEDIDLRQLHQQFAFIATWDDHETANDSWAGGAQNHNDGEGDWFDRKAVGIQAYFEWMPIRLPDAMDEERIYRKLSYGNLADIFVLDTRLEGREEQDGTTNNDPNRTILGQTQFNWLTNGMSNSTAQWKIVAQQVMMAPLGIGGFGVNEDQWDGYPAERQALYDHVLNNNIDNMVVITGDIHTSWANDLPLSNYNPFTGANSAGVEFVTPSITSENGGIPFGTNAIRLANPHVKFVDIDSHGFFMLDLDAQKAQADWFFVPTIDEVNHSCSWESSHFVNTGERNLNEANAPIVVDEVLPLAPLTPPAPLVKVKIKVLLEGAYDTNSGLMTTHLSTLSDFPLQQPFNQAPWNYTSTLEAIGSINDLPANVVDWVLVELYDANDPSLLVAQQAALLLHDGTVVAYDAALNSINANGIHFSGIVPNHAFYIAVRSRNHLASMSAIPIAIPNNTYDFTVAAQQALGQHQLKELAPNVFAQYAGDFNADGVITVEDFNELTTQIGQFSNSYNHLDVDFDGEVLIQDFNAYAPNASVIGIAPVRY